MKFSEILLDNLEEMEFLSNTLESAYLHYRHTSEDLGAVVKKIQFHLSSATLDFAIDLDYKINRKIDKSDFAFNIIRNLQSAAEQLESFTPDHKIINFEEIEDEIVMLVQFIKEYIVRSYDFADDFTGKEIKELNHKILSIRGKKLI